MRKILFCVIVFCLTGCIVTNEDFEKTCTLTKKSDSIKDKMSIYVKYDNEDNVKEAVVTRRYEVLDDNEDILKEIKESGVSFNERYASEDGMKITVSLDNEDVWEVKYYLDIVNLKESILDDFMLKKNSVKFFNKMRDENIECK